MNPPSQPASLVIHDGELADVCALFAHLGLPCLERRGPSTPEDEARVWALVVSTPKRLLEFDPGASGSVPPRIVILDKDSRTLRAMLHRAGIDLLVRRPVHPAALRMLVLYTLYRGPEKRRSLRVSIGARVRYRSGVRRRVAVLADLSQTGCRLLSTHEVEQGRKIQVQIPREVSRDKGFTVRGTAVRVGPSELPGVRTVAISFDRNDTRQAERLRAAVSAHGTGPAVLEAADGDAALRFPQADRPAPLPPPPPPPEPEPQPAEVATDERRGNRRHEFSNRVIALGGEAARVLLGRDISMGGMRVEAHPDVKLGDELRIGLHLRAREKPLVVQARVGRDDGERGLVLQFFDLGPEALDYLRRMVDFLPVLAHREGREDGEGVIVSEIIEHRTGARSER